MEIACCGESRNRIGTRNWKVIRWTSNDVIIIDEWRFLCMAFVPSVELLDAVRSKITDGCVWTGGRHMVR